MMRQTVEIVLPRPLSHWCLRSTEENGHGSGKPLRGYYRRWSAQRDGTKVSLYVGVGSWLPFDAGRLSESDRPSQDHPLSLRGVGALPVSHYFTLESSIIVTLFLLTIEAKPRSPKFTFSMNNTSSKAPEALPANLSI